MYPYATCYETKIIKRTPGPAWKARLAECGTEALPIDHPLLASARSVELELASARSVELDDEGGRGANDEDED